MLRVTPVIDGDRAFVEWWATFDREPPRLGELTETPRIPYGNRLQSLREAMEPPGIKFP